MAKTLNILALLAMLSGCVPSISPDAVKAIQQLCDQQAVNMQNMQDQQAKDLAGINAKIADNAAKGAGAPLSHPFAATNNTIRELHPWLLGAFIVLTAASLAAWISSFVFTSILFLSKIALALSKAAILSLAILIGLPFGIWLVPIIMGAFLVIWVVESIRDHYDFRQGAIDTLASVGIKLGAAPAAAVAEAKVMVSNPPRPAARPVAATGV